MGGEGGKGPFSNSCLTAKQARLGKGGADYNVVCAMILAFCPDNKKFQLGFDSINKDLAKGGISYHNWIELDWLINNHDHLNDNQRFAN